jgi:signal transduction histidine kinase
MPKKSSRKKARISARQENKVRQDTAGLSAKLARGLSHEIKSPLAAIQAAMEILRETEDLSPEGRQIAEEINGEIEQMDRVMKQFLDFSLCPHPQIEEVPLDALVESVRDQLDPDQARVHIDVCAPGALRIRGDIVMLQRVLLELMQNSIDNEAERVVVEGRSVKGKSVIRISDSGGAIDREVASDIFEPFFSTRARHAGLGLSIAQRWLGAMQGTIRLLPERDGFEITLPRINEEL